MTDAYERVAGLSDSIIDSDEQLKKYISAQTLAPTATHQVPPQSAQTAMQMLSSTRNAMFAALKNLYVVDASVFPVIPSATPNLAVMMLGERVSDWLKAARH